MLKKLVRVSTLLTILAVAACGDTTVSYGGTSGLLASGPTGGTPPEYHGLAVPKNAPVRLEFYRPDGQPAEWLGYCQIHGVWADWPRGRVVVEMSGKSGISGNYYYSIRQQGGYVAKVVLHRHCYPEYNYRFGQWIDYRVYGYVHVQWQPFRQ